MNRTFIGAVLVVAASAVAGAQTPTIRYDRSAERTVAGTIRSVAAFPADDGTIGVHLDLRTSEGMIAIHVAPAMFVGQENFWFFADEEVIVVGAPVAGGGAILARTVQKGSTVLVVRNEDGTPRWSSKADGIDGCGVNHLPVMRTTLF